MQGLIIKNKMNLTTKQSADLNYKTINFFKNKINDLINERKKILDPIIKSNIPDEIYSIFIKEPEYFHSTTFVLIENDLNIISIGPVSSYPVKENAMILCLDDCIFKKLKEIEYTIDDHKNTIKRLTENV